LLSGAAEENARQFLRMAWPLGFLLSRAPASGFGYYFYYYFWAPAALLPPEANSP
jgi:hypothetical protein